MDHFKSMFEELKSYKEDDVFTDITIIIQKQKFNLHKVILAAASQYFKLLFTVEMKERNDKEIQIRGVSVAAFEDCVKFIYSGKVEERSSGYPDLLHASCLFQIMQVRAECVKYIQATIDWTNCVQMYQLSLKYDCEEIKSCAKAEIMENAQKILADKSILSQTEVDTIELILQSEDAQISNESVAFHGLVQWVEADEKEREEYFCGLLKYVRLPVVNRDYFTNNIHTNVHLNHKCAKCKMYLTQTVRHLIDGKTHGLESYQIVPRSQKDKRNILLIDDECKFQIIDVKSSSISDCGQTISPVPVATKANSVAYHGEQLYIFGENEGRRCFRSAIGGAWHKISPMPRDHSDHVYRSSTVCFGDKILVIGGDYNDLDTDIVDCFDTVENTWSELPSLIKGRSNHLVIAGNQNVFVIGGWNEKPLNSVEKYDDETKNWNSMPSLNIARQGAAGARYRHKIHVAGGMMGSQNLSSVETYADGDSCWTITGDLNVSRSFGEMVVIDNKLHVFGGVHEEDTCLFEWFNNANQQWEESNMKDDNIQNYKALLCSLDNISCLHC